MNKPKPKPIKQRDIPNTECIEMFLHCALCLKEKPANISPMDWSRTQTGWTKLGLQVWCNRHNCNVVHIDFQGQQHPANLSRRAEVSEGVTVME